MCQQIFNDTEVRIAAPASGARTPSAPRIGLDPRCRRRLHGKFKNYRARADIIAQIIRLGTLYQSMSEETVELEDVTIEAETDLALLCNIDDKKHWIPKSVVHEDSEVSSEGDTGTIVLQRWFAEKEGLV